MTRKARSLAVIGRGGVSGSTLCSQRGVALDATGSLYVADSSNHRVVIYLANTRPTAAPLTLNPKWFGETLIRIFARPPRP